MKGLLTSAFPASFLFAGTIACSGVTEPGEESDSSPQAALAADGLDGKDSYASNYSQVYVRGTPNNWGTTPMELIADHTWSITMAFGGSENERFKFDVHGDWRLNFGDNNAHQPGWYHSGTATRNGGDIVVGQNRTLVISFDDQTLAYYYADKEYSATVYYELPASLAPVRLSREVAWLHFGDARDRQLIYVEGTADAERAYTPISTTRPGDYVLKLDRVVDGRYYTGEAAFTLDGTSDHVTQTMTVTEQPMADFGQVVVHVQADSVENGSLVSSPFANVGVFLGDWQAGERLADTDASGQATVSLRAGDHALSVFLMTSSHSVAMSSGHQVHVIAGQTTETNIHLPPFYARIQANADVGRGKTLYLTGETSYLGNWRTAIKMKYQPDRRAWVYGRNLPIGAQFKVVRANWVEADEISTEGVRWERGNNHTIQRLTHYQSENEITPRF